MTKDIDTIRTPIAKSNQVIETRLPGELILLDQPSGEMYSLNETGRFVWERLGRSSPHQIAAELANAFDVAPARAGADLRSLVANLARAGLVRRAGEVDS